MTNAASKQDGELAPGDLCDGYRIVSIIAAGGMGDVYEAIHQASGNLVAFKCLKVRHRNKEDARARMKMEAVVLSELQHANLVKVFDAGVTDVGMVWIAMERLHGQTLRDVLLRAGQLPISDALYYASEVADGVDAVHEVNVIHRDLKPENVFVTTRKSVKVLDLGTGKFTGYGLNSTDKMRVVGTTAYMSPEQIKGLRVDARADVYALGLMVYEMIAGHHPLAQHEAGVAGLPQAIEQIALMQLQMTPRPLADIVAACPGYISAIVDKAITKDRERRFANMTAFSRELRTARKRFIAENRLDDSPIDMQVGSDRLREKFGAPPRTSSNPPPPPIPAPAIDAGSSGSRPTIIDRPAADDHVFQTLVEDRPPRFTQRELTPSPVGREPTVDLSGSSIPAMPGRFDQPSDLTDRGPPPDDVRNRTTHTNPLGALRATDLTPEPHSLSEPKRGSLLGLTSHPLVRRAVLTFGLGAVIGIPPAVIAVAWSVHRRSLVVVAPVAATPLAGIAPPEDLAASVPVPPPNLPSSIPALDEAPPPLATLASAPGLASSEGAPHPRLAPRASPAKPGAKHPIAPPPGDARETPPQAPPSKFTLPPSGL